MTSPGAPKNRRAAWLRWILFSEGLILLLAIAGPGSRYAFRERGDHALLARWFIDDPGFFDALLVNFVVLHLFIGAAWLAAVVVIRVRHRS